MSLTAAQIVAKACQIARVPGFTAQGGQWLNLVLAELANTYDLSITRVQTTITLVADNGSGNGAGPYALPATYLRAIFDEVFFTIQGVKYDLTPVDYSEYLQLVQTPGLENYPTVWATDMSASPPNGYVWMPSSGAYPLTVGHYAQPADIVTPESSASVPWFPFQGYLITRVAGELMREADDSRATSFLGDGESGALGMLRRYLNLVNDSSNRAKTVKLDKRRFGSPFNRLPNTKLVGW